MSYPVGPQSTEIHDAELVRRCRQGDTTAFDTLVLRHQRQVYAVALRMLGDPDDAKDIAQDAFVRAYEGLAGFREHAKFSTWVTTIVMNLCRNKRRWWMRRKRVIVASLDEPLETDDSTLGRQVADPGLSPSEQAANAQLRRQLQHGLQALDEDSRGVIVLRDVEGLSYEEMAKVLNCELGTVKSRLCRARFKLKALLDGQLG